MLNNAVQLGMGVRRNDVDEEAYRSHHLRSLCVHTDTNADGHSDRYSDRYACRQNDNRSARTD
ncbi:MAG: hypothetical protein OXI33_01180 [Chloroflexota bacterium]|nr:hypothetical protein [Chloroflexota bacterium]